MMVKAFLQKADGKLLGQKSIPEDCLAVQYGGATFVRVTDNGTTAIYRMTDTFHFHKLDHE